MNYDYHVENLNVDINLNNFIYYSRLPLIATIVPAHKEIDIYAEERTINCLNNIMGTAYYDGDADVKLFLKAFNIFYSNNSFKCIQALKNMIVSLCSKGYDSERVEITEKDYEDLFVNILLNISEYNIINLDRDYQLYGNYCLLWKICTIINLALNIDSLNPGFLKPIVKDIQEGNFEYYKEIFNFKITMMDCIDPVKIKQEEFIPSSYNNDIFYIVPWKITDPRYKSNLENMIKTITKSKFTDFSRNVTLFINSMNNFTYHNTNEVTVHLNSILILFTNFEFFTMYNDKMSKEGRDMLIDGIHELLFETNLKISDEQYQFDNKFFVYLYMAWNLNKFNPDFLVPYVDVDKNTDVEKVNEEDKEKIINIIPIDILDSGSILNTISNIFKDKADEIANNIENVSKELEKDIKNNNGPDQNNISWDQYYMAIATLVRERSKDPVTKVGACIVKDNKVISTGYNGFPIGISDYTYPWSKNSNKPTENKYFYVVHAELNAILSAKQSLDGCTLYVTKFPCNECAKAIIQSGIKKIIYREPSPKFYKGKIDKEIVLTLFKEAGIECVFYHEEGREIKITI